MNIDEIVNFTYSRNKLWQKLMTKEQLKKFFEKHKDNIIEARIKGELVGVGFYWQIKDELHFLSATVKENINGVSIMLRAIKDKVKETSVKYVSWYTPDWKFKKWEVNKQCHKQHYQQ